MNEAANRDRDTLDQATLNKAYARWAPVYDLVFGKVFDPGRKASIAAAERIGGHILDVGIGTGISLLDFSATNTITGIDISEPMLQRARQRVREGSLENVRGLAVMDAQRLGFDSNAFDVVVAQYVITAVPDPDAALDEFVRVLKPGGELILINHIGAETGPRRLFERCFAPLARRLGWRPEFPWRRIADWVSRRSSVRLIERRPMPPLGHFSMIRLAKSA
jgi:phosphatidylethanolamine/phosphatidyl-N-methylethanolamine N-methyltransferase